MLFFYYFEKNKDSKHAFATSLPIEKFGTICTVQTFGIYVYIYVYISIFIFWYFNKIIYFDFTYIYDMYT